MKDIKNKKLLYWKGVLFAVLGMMAASLLLLENPSLRNFILLMIMIWAFCRFYYFLFYVIEKYADPTFRYAGVGSLLRHQLSKKR